MSLRKQSFPPVVREDTRLLILGSLPGEKSLAASQYYAHPQNRFWHLLERVICVPLVARDYQDRLALLLDHKIGLWDAVRSAERKGSLDTAMRAIEGADLRSLISRLPQLRAVAFNGRKSETIGRPQLAGLPVECAALPSSSPAYASLSFAEKAEEWYKLQQFLR